MKKENQKKGKELISQKEYNKVLRNLRLEQIMLVEARAYFDRSEGLSGSIKEIAIVPEEKVKALMEGDKIIGAHSLRLLGKIPEDKEGKTVFEIYCEFVCIFSSKEALRKNFVELFERRNLRIFTVPYLREFVQNISTRMGLQPIILPMYKQ